MSVNKAASLYDVKMDMIRCALQEKVVSEAVGMTNVREA